MPWKVFSDNKRHCVYKVGNDGNRMGESLGCHETESDAMAQMRALYANENSKSSALKFADSSELEVIGLLAPHGGPFNGRDITGEYFSPNTDFVLGWYEGDRPLIWQHGLDAKTGVAVVGRIKSLSRDELGLWMKAQLDAANEYYEAIKELIKAGKIGLSSGSMRHLVTTTKSGEILRWPLIEGSLTPTPCNPLADVDFAAAEKHYEAAGIKADLSALKLDSSDMPHSEDEHERMVSKKPTKMTPDMMRQMMKRMAADMEVDMSDSEMEMMMGEMEGMEEDEAEEHAKKKMQKMAQKAVSPDDPMSLSIHAEMTKAFAVGLVERTKDLRERRIKEGRIISTPNRKKLSECLDSMRAACDSMQTLLDATEPPAKAGDVERARARLKILKLYTATLN